MNFGKIALFAILFSLSQFSLSQELPKVIPPSPEASALFRYQDYPMDYSTGLPQISVPIYEIKSGSLSVPISLSYHASGLRVEDQDGPIALGWSLNAGGMISRTVYGSPDFGVYPFPYPFNTTDINSVNNLDYLQQINHYVNYQAPGYFKDSEYDIFSYTFGGAGGKFIFKDVNGVKTPVFLPFKPYKVTPIGQAPLGSLEIVDDKGIYYKFSGNEFADIYSGSGPSGFSVTRIVSADKLDTINFLYSTFVQTRKSISRDYIVYDTHNNRSNSDLLPGYNDIPNSTENTSTISYSISRINRIDFRQGSVVFNLVPNSDKIGSIQINDKNGNLITTIQFNTSLLVNTDLGKPPLNKLDGIDFKDNAGVVQQKYSFEYFPFLYAQSKTILDSHYCDYWGYYNASGVQEMVPYWNNIDYIGRIGQYYTITVGETQASTRLPNLEAMKSGVLKKITYPTGGTTEFNYECNKYLSVLTNQVTNGPGLRVSQTITDSKQGISQIKSFKYGVNESGYGAIELEPSVNSMFTELRYKFMNDVGVSSCTWGPAGSGWYRERIFHSGFNPELSVISNRPVIYTEVAEYHGTPTDNIGKTVYNYDNNQWYAGGLFNSSKNFVGNQNFWNSPSLIKSTNFKTQTGSPQFVPMQMTENVYSSLVAENIKGLKVVRWYNLPQTGLNTCPQGPANVNVEAYSLVIALGATDPYFPPLIYGAGEYSIPAGSKNLTQTKETIYNDDGSTTVRVKNYTYNSNQMIFQVSQVDSDGSTLISETKYPFDYSGAPVLSQMVGLNMVNFLIEQNEYKNGNPVKSNRNNYYDWGTTTPKIALQSVDLKIGSNNYETRLSYFSYDLKGNPSSFSKVNDIKHSYLWDYNYALPIADIANADINSVAVTSFEADGSGQWSGINKANIRSDVPGITGKKYFDLTGNTLTCGALDPNTTFIVSYWSRGNAANVTNTTSGWPQKLATKTINGVAWNYWEHRITNTSSASVTGSLQLDELRLYPLTSQVTSYTYDPLIGVTSVCDQANSISYYEYDAFGRLKLIRNVNGDILKTYTYALQATTPN